MGRRVPQSFVALFCASLSLTLALGACGPSLRRGGEFTPKRVRATLFADECKLQPYHDKNPPPPRLLSDQNISEDSAVAWGRATYRLRGAAQALALRSLLDRTYDGLKFESAPTSPIQLEVRYHLRGGRRQIPIGAKTVVRGLGQDPVVLPYHPCIGAFLFGREHYAARRQLVAR